MMPATMSEGWPEIARSAWSLLQNPDLPFVVRPSIPILYFGDLKAYRASPLRILTVGLNPSRKEFPTDSPFRRFPGGDRLVANDVGALMKVLNGYFRADPYTSWFGSYEPVLNGLDASYYGNRRSTALHTDLFSPIATDPTWTGLHDEQRAPLKVLGIRLWHDITRLLQPHLVVLSIARKHLRKLDFVFDGPWRPVAELTEGKSGPRSRPYVVKCRRTLAPDQPTFAFGPAAQMPFGTVARDDRVAIGRRIREFLDSRS